ncbi:ZYRO0B08514p [Zygosaccharomyces rouxii]|uniref:ZYRO0B08514p n=1 Tax=Zygosaccharomyces rouxii (strain ATCC 2623 / CBS 732 / NBRC 1130 / NCYC 568 / NRRL Y-229) TaxID=559307 RepID=C5DRH6_ZYGRC|nr:uncharacterized protein ZYRO0B08514g [Zygosaccharomyces rouxii]KAH9200075.1 hypothetical protein LQ764DRAFT_234620 [Zygosaccharomyces rouxii]CAR26387.1 ZYRO0B08514p [Zygosaccharomyces rouxii]
MPIFFQCSSHRTEKENSVTYTYMPLSDYYQPLKRLWNLLPIDHSMPQMIPSMDIVASFSRNVTQFAFQANLSQKNAIDIYSLDPSNDYSINSSLVNRVDYEGNDLKASEVFFIGWCTSSEENSTTKTKRTQSDENRVTKDENFLVNGFPDGKIVVFSSTGKQIVNIIQNKKQILHIDTESEFIWILDSESTVKKLPYTQTKPVKSFQLIDGRDEEITSFRVLPRQKKNVYLALSTKDALFIIDPTNSKPRTVLKLGLTDCKYCQLFYQNGEKLVVTTDDRVLVFNVSDGELIQEWNLQVKKLRIFGDVVLALDTQGTISALKIGNDQNLSQIEIPQSQVIDFIPLKDILLIAWLNVNEPNFKVIPLEKINSGEKIVIDDLQMDTETQDLDGKVNHQLDDGNGGPKYEKKKVSRAEQDELSQSLINFLEKSDSEGVLETISSQNWTEQRIKSFVVFHVNNYETARLIFEVISSNFQREVWNKESSLAEWLRWLLTLRGDSLDSKHMKKNTKHLRSTLKNSGESLPTLIGIQGRLELLRKQAQLREDLANLNVAEDDDKVETVNHENAAVVGDGEGQDDSVQFINGESDTYVDAQEK